VEETCLNVTFLQKNGRKPKFSKRTSQAFQSEKRTRTKVTWEEYFIAFISLVQLPQVLETLANNPIAMKNLIMIALLFLLISMTRIIDNLL
jgi:hypothetical protein